jgi:CubicO group peptidase (beta-lactamase class C family)
LPSQAPSNPVDDQPLAISACGRMVDHLYEEFARKEHVPGLVFGLIQEGRLAHLKCFGYADLGSARRVLPETRFRIASMTKTVTALALLQLHDDGVVSLESSLADYVPELRAACEPTRDSGPITLRDLLNHIAGLVTDDPWADRMLGMPPAAFTDLIRGGELAAQAPGLAYEYSNLGYALLGRVITNVAARPYQEFIDERILRPLGMKDTCFAFRDLSAEDRATGYAWRQGAWAAEPVEPDGEFGAMGGLVTHALDYARYAAFLLDAWPARDDDETFPIRRATRRHLARVHAPPLPPMMRQYRDRNIPVSSAYAYGLVHSYDELLGEYLHHFGGLPGYGSHVLLSPQSGNGLFAFGNRTYAPLFLVNVQAASALTEAGAWVQREARPSEPLSRAAEAVLEIYRSGRIESAAALIAANLLLDQPALERDALLRRLKRRFGEARAQSIAPRHARAARFSLICTRGCLAGEVVLTPGPEAKIQMLHFESG